MSKVQTTPEEARSGEVKTVSSVTVFSNGQVQLVDAGFDVFLPQFARIEVDRPDPDAELIEVMARGMAKRMGREWGAIETLIRDRCLGHAKAALAAAREAGLLPEVTQ